MKLSHEECKSSPRLTLHEYTILMYIIFHVHVLGDTMYTHLKLLPVCVSKYKSFIQIFI